MKIIIIILQAFQMWVFDPCGTARNDLWAHTPAELPKYVDGVPVVDLTRADSLCYERVKTKCEIIWPEGYKFHVKGEKDFDRMVMKSGESSDTIYFEKVVDCPERGDAMIHSYFGETWVR